MREQVMEPSHTEGFIIHQYIFHIFLTMSDGEKAEKQVEYRSKQRERDSVKHLVLHLPETCIHSRWNRVRIQVRLRSKKNTFPICQRSKWLIPYCYFREHCRQKAFVVSKWLGGFCISLLFGGSIDHGTN